MDAVRQRFAFLLETVRLQAFVPRFARLQDSVGDKLLPALRSRVGEPVGTALDDLDRCGAYVLERRLV